MRPGMRASSPARSDAATSFAARNQLFGGEPLWAVSPYLQNGSNDKTQNARGNLHSQNGSSTGAAGLGSMALSSLGNTYTGAKVLFNATISGTSMTVHSISSGGNNITTALRFRHSAQAASAASFWITTNANGGGVGTYTLNTSPGNVTTQAIRGLESYLADSGASALSVVETAGKKRHSLRVEYNDYNAAGQQGRKVLIRNSDTASELANGLGAGGLIGDTVLYAFSISVPAATRALLAKFTDVLFWQIKNSGDAPNLSLNFAAAIYRNGYTTPPGAGTGPSIIFRVGNTEWRVQIRVLDNYPADTPLHFVMQIRYGIHQWTTATTYGPGEQVHNAGNVYVRTAAGGQPLAAGVTAPTGTGTGISDGACVWDWVKATPAGNVAPTMRMWIAVGSAPHSEIDISVASFRTNYFSINDFTQCGMQYGWYTSYVGTDNDGVVTVGPDVTWAPGDSKTVEWSEMTVARPEIARQAPNAQALTQWFSQLRDRF